MIKGPLCEELAVGAQAGTRGRPVIALRWIIGFLLAWVSLDNVLLLGFLGMNPILVGFIGLAAMTGVFVCVGRLSAALPRIDISVDRILICGLIALLLLMLGGEGRLLFANTDWQIRDALLRDMGRSPWPYAYQIGDTVQLLRAPIGMYLKPALIGGSNQLALDSALLACNTLVLGGLFAIGSVLFNTNRARLIAVTVFVFFSGLDILGALTVQLLGSSPSFEHLEPWLARSQYSSTLTLIFWVPQHAIAGWLCAALFLLWERGHIRFSLFLGAIPILAIWSPLAVIGAVPFALYAGFKGAWRRDIEPSDMLFGVLVVVVAIPALVYLRAGLSEVNSGVALLPLTNFLLLVVFELAPFALFIRGNSHIIRLGGFVIGLTVLLLLALPHYRIGPGDDFQMRAAIMPIAILALIMGHIMSDQSRNGRSDRIVLGILLMLGAVTGAMEIRRAIIWQPSPETHCALTQAYFQQTGLIAPTSSYFARVDALPSPLRPDKPLVIPQTTDMQCWNRQWKTPR
jgi:hypothetical protein